MLHFIWVFTVCQITLLGQRVNSPLSDEFNQGMSLGPQKVTRPVAHMLYIRLIKGNIKKIFLSESTRPRGLILYFKL